MPDLCIFNRESWSNSIIRRYWNFINNRRYFKNHKLIGVQKPIKGKKKSLRFAIDGNIDISRNETGWNDNQILTPFVWISALASSMSLLDISNVEPFTDWQWSTYRNAQGADGELADLVAKGSSLYRWI